MRQTALGVAIVIVAMGASAMAQQPQGASGAEAARAARERQSVAMLQRLDVNHDGAISIDEWPRPGRAFARLDVDKDMRLSASELQRAPTPRQFARQQRIAKHVQRRVRRMDTNRDRAISLDEWRGKAEMFDRLDADKDGTVTGAELRAFSASGRAARGR